MTLREAVEFLHAGYGDDCPEGGDRYIEAMMTLSDAGLIDYEPQSSTWPRPKPSPMTQALLDMYLPAIKADLNRSIMFLREKD